MIDLSDLQSISSFESIAQSHARLVSKSGSGCDPSLQEEKKDPSKSWERKTAVVSNSALSLAERKKKLLVIAICSICQEITRNAFSAAARPILDDVWH
eukprot:scaffold22642_cov134-Cylindrotheca_fusiformis.AAC.7